MTMKATIIRLLRAIQRRRAQPKLKVQAACDEINVH
jgi:hypothetical protein